MIFAIIAGCLALIMFIMSLTGIFQGTYYYSDYYTYRYSYPHYYGFYRVSYWQYSAAVTKELFCANFF